MPWHPALRPWSHLHAIHSIDASLALLALCMETKERSDEGQTAPGYGGDTHVLSHPHSPCSLWVPWSPVKTGREGEGWSPPGLEGGLPPHFSYVCPADEDKSGEAGQGPPVNAKLSQILGSAYHHENHRAGAQGGKGGEEGQASCSEGLQELSVPLEVDESDGCCLSPGLADPSLKAQGTWGRAGSQGRCLLAMSPTGTPPPPSNGSSSRQDEALCAQGHDLKSSFTHLLPTAPLFSLQANTSGKWMSFTHHVDQRGPAQFNPLSLREPGHAPSFPGTRLVPGPQAFPGTEKRTVRHTWTYQQPPSPPHSLLQPKPGQLERPDSIQEWPAVRATCASPGSHSELPE
jgi:hypothetical protein